HHHSAPPHLPSFPTRRSSDLGALIVSPRRRQITLALALYPGTKSLIVVALVMRTSNDRRTSPASWEIRSGSTRDRVEPTSCSTRSEERRVGEVDRWEGWGWCE